MPVLHPRLLALPLLLPLLVCLPAGWPAAQPRPAAAPADPDREAAPGVATGQGPAPLPAPADDIAEPTLPYETELRPTGDGTLDTLLQGVSALRRLQAAAPTTAEGLVARALQDQGALIRALRAEGYYDGRPVVLLNGEAPDAPLLAQRLAAAPGPVRATIGAETGPRYTIGSVRVTPEAPEADITAAGEVSGLAPGDPARAQEVVNAGERLLTGLREAGHPFAAIARREVVVDHDTRLMEVTYVLAPGPRARFAMPEVEGATHVDPRLLRAVAGQLEDRPYDPRQLDRVRRDIVALGVFGTARARAAEQLDASGRLPVTFLVAERPFRAIGGTIAYETRNGPTGRIYWEHRNIFGAAERLRLEAEVGRTTESASGDNLNARVSANLRKPWLFGRNMSLVMEVAALRERLLAYDRDAVTANVALETRPEPRLTLSGGVLMEYGDTTEDGIKTNNQLVGLIGTALWDDTDNVLNPSRGQRANLLVSPIYSLNGSNVFVRIRAGGSTYFDLRHDQGTILALRGSLGSIVGSEAGQVPPHLRFYAGGGGSVRGYDFQRIGPRNRSGRPRGGLSLVEASVEVRQRISGPWGMAAFVDAGSVGTDEMPDFGQLRFGAGLGLRYATAIGPIRADVAIPLNQEPGNNSFGLYVGIGQAF
ncbi:autotransporter assembly complex protein TamA [Roseomonas sp. OT10]|uniref:autotransporter assembly complex protein TamA n=1 Tax=Roseomonas cutis TaxID=2897332 RepID=UPI001E49E370|nr:autotransporter assembly complex family protein [Roseomonas sp. OT10]UFN50941.1 autotransporter assembly complex protein TamA [Roseomonas sp. OT10]